MKKIVKQMMALVLALAMAITFMPVNVQAASKIKYANSGKVKVVYYKGAKAKKANVNVTIENKAESKTYNGKLCDHYVVNVKISRPKLSKTDIVKTVKESRKKKSKIADYWMALLDANGNQINEAYGTSIMDYNASSSSKTLKAKEGRRNYYIYSYRKTTVHKFDIYVPQEIGDFYLCVAGLRKGQIKESKMDKLNDRKISYTSAGFGDKKGFALAAKVR